MPTPRDPRDNPAQQSQIDERNELTKKWRSIAEPAIALMTKPETRARMGASEGSTAAKPRRTSSAELGTSASSFVG